MGDCLEIVVFLDNREQRKQMNKTEKIPCKECLIISLCRHKNYKKLVKECSKLNCYLQPEYEYSDILCNLHRKRCKELYRVMKPSSWKLGEKIIYGGYYLIE